MDGFECKSKNLDLTLLIMKSTGYEVTGADPGNRIKWKSWAVVGWFGRSLY